MFRKQCCCETGQRVFERGHLVSAPSDVRFTRLSSWVWEALDWQMSMELDLRGFKNCECSLLNVNYRLVAA